MRTICPHCKQEFEVGKEFLNQNASCPSCAKSFTVQEIKVCARCGTANPHNALICRKCHQDLTVADAFRSGPGEEAEVEEVTFADRWETIREKLSPIFRVLIKLLILAAIAFGAWKGYEYFVGRKAAAEEEEKRKREEELRRQEEEQIRMAYPRMRNLGEELKKTFHLGKNLDMEAIIVFDKWQKKAEQVRQEARDAGIIITRNARGYSWPSNPGDKADVDKRKRQVAYYSNKAYWACNSKLRAIHNVRLGNINRFIVEYDAIMTSAKKSPMTEKTKKDLRSLALISRTDAEIILRLKNFPEMLNHTQDLDVVAKLMESEFSPEEKEDLLIVYLSGNNWRRESSYADKIIDTKKFPQQLMSDSEIASIDRLVKEKFIPDVRDNESIAKEKKVQLRKKLMREYLSQKWRDRLQDLKNEEYQRALAYYIEIRTRLEKARHEVLTLVIRDHMRNFSHGNFSALEAEYFRRKNLPPEARERIEDDYARVMTFAQNTKRKGKLTYYDPRYFDFCNDLSPQLMNFGLLLEYPPQDWENAFPEETVWLSDENSNSNRYYYRTSSDYDDDGEYNAKAEMFAKEYSPTELFAEIARVDAIIKELSPPKTDDSQIKLTIPNIELLNGIFLYPEERRAEIQKQSNERVRKKQAREREQERRKKQQFQKLLRKKPPVKK